MPTSRWTSIKRPAREDGDMDNQGRIQQSIARDPIYTLYLYDDAVEDHAVYASIKFVE
jgi:hypothetical protein